MSQFLREYAGQMNLSIDKGVNALELDSGVVVILDFGQGLRSGNRMEKSLINPNQFRKFGTKIYNEPTNPHRKLGIETSEDLFILMKMGGSLCCLVTRHPTDDELHECQKNSHWMNFIGIHQRICLKCLQRRRSIVKVQMFINTSILSIVEFHVHLQQFSVDMTQEFISLIDQCKMFPLDWPSTCLFTY